MAGPIALVGGDEFRDGCEPMDREILDATGASRPRVLIVPTAAARQNPSKAAANGVAYFEGLGAEADSLMVLDSEDAGDYGLVSRVRWADVIYLTGGDPAHLLNVLRGSRMLESVKEAVSGGAVLAGSSAGAMVLGEWMRYGGVRPALGLLDGLAVLPHHERSTPDHGGRRACGDCVPRRFCPGHRCWSRMPRRKGRLEGRREGLRRPILQGSLAPLSVW